VKSRLSFLVAAALAVVAVGLASAHAAGTRLIVAKRGDTVRFAGVAVTCRLAPGEVGALSLLCVHTPRAHFQVVYYRDSLTVYRIGNPDKPAFDTGRP
jgi:hypothetical protein